MLVLKGKTALKTGAHRELAKLILLFDYPADIRKVIYTTTPLSR
jgi:transposase-like protein